MIEQLFTNLGGTFVCSFSEFQEKTNRIKAFVFDWDGVFTNAHKNANSETQFSEADSMGLNMLRFSYWLKEEVIPVSGILTGAKNITAQYLADREHVHFIYESCKDKAAALAQICKDYKLKPSEICYTYDDILDVEVARQVGLSLFIKRTANPLLQQYLQKEKVCDYISAHTGGEHAVRELCELLIACKNNYEEIVEKRSANHKKYQEYLKQRQNIQTENTKFIS